MPKLSELGLTSRTTYDCPMCTEPMELMDSFLLKDLDKANAEGRPLMSCRKTVLECFVCGHIIEVDDE